MFQVNPVALKIPSGKEGPVDTTDDTHEVSLPLTICWDMNCV